MTVKDLRIQYLRDTGLDNQPMELVIEEDIVKEEMNIFKNGQITLSDENWKVYPEEYVQWLEEQLIKASENLLVLREYC